jgi:hypothetical protein
MVFAAAFTVLAAAAPAAAQSVTQADIDRLEALSADITVDMDNARARNVSLGNLDLTAEELREEVIYLKVKQRKGERISRSEYNDVRTRLETLQSRTRATASGISGGMAGSGTRRDRNRTYRDGEIPEGTELDVRLEQPLDSETAQLEQRFEGTTAADIYQNERVLIPAGSRVRGIVSSVDKASRTDRRGSMTLAFDQITVNGRTYDMRGTVTQVLEADKSGEVAKIGGGAGVGAVIGGILGGIKGAILGAVIGAGGTIAATEGSDVKLEQGTILRVRLDQPLAISRY